MSVLSMTRFPGTSSRSGHEGITCSVTQFSNLAVFMPFPLIATVASWCISLSNPCWACICWKDKSLFEAIFILSAFSAPDEKMKSGGKGSLPIVPKTKVHLSAMTCLRFDPPWQQCQWMVSLQDGHLPLPWLHQEQMASHQDHSSAFLALQKHVHFFVPLLIVKQPPRKSKTNTFVFPVLVVI
jgi:hypothetical protein